MAAAKLELLKDIPIHAIRLKSHQTHPLKGNGEIDTVCGGCERVIAFGIAPSELRQLYPNRQVVVECRCGAHNALPH